jgi:glycerophosphoryl diester phosphodiesterase
VKGDDPGGLAWVTGTAVDYIQEMGIDRYPGLVEIVAHRGSGQDEARSHKLHPFRPAAPPENTLPAFEWSWARGWACELDVRRTLDGEIIVIHDETTGRTCDRDLKVSESTLDELRRLDAGVKKGSVWRGLRLPTLREVLEVMPAQGRLYVEMKQGPGIVDPVLAEIDAAGKGPDQIVFISFGIDTVARLKKSRPEFACYLIVAFEQVAPQRWRARYRETEADGLTLRRVGLEPLDYARLVALVRNDDYELDGLDVSCDQPDDFAEAMHRAEIAWGSWTVDDADTAVRLARKGAFQLTSNCADDIWGALHYPDTPSWPSGS